MQPIGIIRSPFKELVEMPIQPKGAVDIEGRVIVDIKYEKGLADLEGFSHIYLLYAFHLADREELTVVPFMDDQPRGVFATRSPLRPNHIGLSIVELLKREGNELIIRGVDILDGTPLLDIKPYIRQFDTVEVSKSGWCTADDNEVRQKRSDSRFT
ncbi:MAG: tRNA (N6-threonylcarbamoyladenosine(37)-N6)-methyltransferase TrmO [Desulfocapsaceae bacterium]|nr:tRNA (N6-threonylcarbamoyladenosine(37)-N6)-methyltransferase TrmO [Desulfocapsaceae bacterium]